MSRRSHSIHIHMTAGQLSCTARPPPRPPAPARSLPPDQPADRPPDRSVRPRQPARSPLRRSARPPADLPPDPGARACASCACACAAARRRSNRSRRRAVDAGRDRGRGRGRGRHVGAGRGRGRACGPASSCGRGGGGVPLRGADRRRGASNPRCGPTARQVTGATPRARAAPGGGAQRPGGGGGVARTPGGRGIQEMGSSTLIRCCPRASCPRAASAGPSSGTTPWASRADSRHTESSQRRSEPPRGNLPLRRTPTPLTCPP